MASSLVGLQESSLLTPGGPCLPRLRTAANIQELGLGRGLETHVYERLGSFLLSPCPLPLTRAVVHLILDAFQRRTWLARLQPG